MDIIFKPCINNNKITLTCLGWTSHLLNFFFSTAILTKLLTLCKLWEVFFFFCRFWLYLSLLFFFFKFQWWFIVILFHLFVVLLKCYRQVTHSSVEKISSHLFQIGKGILLDMFKKGVASVISSFCSLYFCIIVKIVLTLIHECSYVRSTINLYFQTLYLVWMCGCVIRKF